MNIKLGKADVEKLKALINVRNDNFKILEIYSAYLNNVPKLVDAALVRDIADSCSVSEERAFVSILSAAVGLDTEINMSDRAFEEKYFIPSVKKLSPKDYSDNPYLSDITLPRVASGEWEFMSLSYKPYEGFIYRDTVLKDGFIEIPQLGFFGCEYSFPAVLQKGREWMAVKPNEIETMKEPISAVSGRVLTLGLGLGYFAYMASEKSSVTEVTVIEKDETVIALFKKHILPQFKNGHKIKIICADAFEYVEDKLSDGCYDYAFADLWHDTSDGFDMYLRLKRCEKRFKSTQFLYWIEKSLLSHLRWLLFDEIAETVLLCKLQDGSGNSVRSFDDITELLSDGELRKIAGSLRRI